MEALRVGMWSSPNQVQQTICEFIGSFTIPGDANDVFRYGPIFEIHEGPKGVMLSNALKYIPRAGLAIFYYDIGPFGERVYKCFSSKRPCLGHNYSLREISNVILEPYQIISHCQRIRRDVSCLVTKEKTYIKRGGTFILSDWVKAGNVITCPHE